MKRRFVCKDCYGISCVLYVNDGEVPKYCPLKNEGAGWQERLDLIYREDAEVLRTLQLKLEEVSSLISESLGYIAKFDRGIANDIEVAWSNLLTHLQKVGIGDEDMFGGEVIDDGTRRNTHKIVDCSEQTRTTPRKSRRR